MKHVVAARQPGVRLTTVAAVVGALFQLPAFAAENAETTLSTVEVVGTTPINGIGVAKDAIPSNVQSLSAKQLRDSQSQNLPELMARQMPSVTVNEVQGNPYQPDVNYRGFTASPLLGTPQGLSVFLDGVRANEPFGDTVNWDLIPKSAIASMDLIPGSNPVFGLNTLGGAIAVHTKSGFTHPGGELAVSGGSFDRRNGEFAYGGSKDNLGWFVSGDWFKENGWRDYSASEVRQLFGKLSMRGDKGIVDLSLLRAQSNLVGNGLLPQSMYSERRSQIFTHPDQTKNDLTQLTLSGSYFLTDTTSLSGSVYHRRNRSRTLNGDANDGYEQAYEDWVTAGSIPGDEPTATGAINRTRTVQRGSGLSGQWNLQDERHNLAVGAAYDEAHMRFWQTQQDGVLDATRGVGDLRDETLENELRGTTRTASVYLTDTYKLAEGLHLTAAARYNRSHIFNRDQKNPGVANNLDADYTYHKLNPALGVTWQLMPAMTAYLGANQGNRVPTPIELGCANPDNPCTLPNSMASDPHLRQVVARTIEAGLRGQFSGGTQWNAGVYRTVNTDDILFVGTSRSAGYFTNFGKTQRQGIELGLNGTYSRVDWTVNYSYLDARFKSDACILSANNSTRGTSAECPASDEILVQSGNKLTGLPEHSLKLGMRWKATDAIRLGGDIQAFSGQYVRGNENNQHQAGTFNGRTFDGPGKLPGYAILNLNASADLSKRWELFGKINNVFDKRYATSGALAENPFLSGSFQANPDDWRHETFVAPGAPRAAWLGVRYRFAEK